MKIYGSDGGICQNFMSYVKQSKSPNKGILLPLKSMNPLV